MYFIAFANHANGAVNHVLYEGGVAKAGSKSEYSSRVTGDCAADDMGSIDDLRSLEQSLP